MNAQVQTVDSSSGRRRRTRRRLCLLVAIVVALTIGGRLWGREGDIDPRLVGKWTRYSADQGEWRVLFDLGLEPNGTVDRGLWGCRGYETYQWSVRGNELRIETSLAVKPLDGLAEFKIALRHLRNRLLHSEELCTRYEIVALTDSCLKLRRLNSCQISDASRFEEYVREKQ